MKNKFLVLLFALVMILGVVGCSKKANDNANMKALPNSLRFMTM